MNDPRHVYWHVGEPKERIYVGIDLNMHLRSTKPNRVGSNSGGDTARSDPDPDPTMATAGIPTSPTIPEGIDLEDLPDRKLLFQIISNQKCADKKSEERFTSLRKQIKDSKKSLENYAKENDTRMEHVETSISNTAADLKSLQEKVTSLESKLDITTNLLTATQQQLDGAKNEIKDTVKILGKLDRKYERDEEEVKRCSLILDGVNERENKRPRSVVSNLMKDLSIEYKEADIKAAYRLGPVRNGIARPRSIKVLFVNPATKGEIFKNIDKLKQNDAWKGVRLSDAISPQEQSQQRDLRCIFAAAKAQGINVKLRGSSIIIDDIKYSYKDINSLPYGLCMENVKIVKVSDGLAFQSHHAFMSNMFPCEIIHNGIKYKSAEHYYSAELARYHSRNDLVQPIIEAQDGYAAKRVVRNIKLSDEWQEEKVKTMKKIIEMKFDQNDSLRDRLLGTKGMLYEATKSDLDFACGYTLSQTKDIKRDSLKGKNLLGVILCEYRDKILGN